ncbi:MAG: 1-acylglycerol-3-phosphate O-acyltransferase, partial [Sinobacteraceae bacterium]|nr:1-acylglycerol-3-phosphate O-acyltransferase [Nevskiaceae bacterium]
RKAAAVVQFGADHATDPRLSYAYSNGAEDIPFLEAVGKPMALNPEPALAATARQRGWPQTRFRPRRKAPTGDRFRTVLAYSSMATSALGGLLLNAAGSPRREAVNVIMGTATDAGLAAAGIKLHILGEENLWAQRPAVFIINHQSKLDFLLGVNLIRRDTTGVAKKEARNVPGFGQFMQYAGMAFVDRANSKAAREAMKPAVDKLKAGMSLGIAPEGTRSYSPRLGPFKKGAFHLARQGGVPIVPIVFRNAWECMHRNDQWFHPGTVDVAVLPPIDISGWKVAGLDRHVADVRQLYLDLLADWPQSRAEFDDRFGAAA